MNAPKRERSVNFSSDENRLLVDIAISYKSVIESKQADTDARKQKDQTWTEIAKKFNSITALSAARSVKTLRLKYDGMKKGLRKKLSERRKADFLMGEGPYMDMKLHDFEERLLSSVNFKPEGLAATGSDGIIETGSQQNCYAVDDKNAVLSTTSIEFTGKHRQNADIQQAELVQTTQIQFDYDEVAAGASAMNSVKTYSIICSQDSKESILSDDVEPGPSGIGSVKITGSPMQQLISCSDIRTQNSKKSILNDDVDSGPSGIANNEQDTIKKPLHWNKLLKTRPRQQLRTPKRTAGQQKFTKFADKKLELINRELELLEKEEKRKEHIYNKRMENLIKEDERKDELHKMQMKLLKLQLFKKNIRGCKLFNKIYIN